jgi:hypothetical protein
MRAYNAVAATDMNRGICGGEAGGEPLAFLLCSSYLRQPFLPIALSGPLIHLVEDNRLKWMFGLASELHLKDHQEPPTK